ncbi:hypothetical protein V6N11_013133 [Hibiscus sabdariffa]|uniref:Uncharacterized protein n=1 Tax=Hibiscus sabdariffa TaxID=183260 RepID=A0ABR2NEV4_9ROSI
MEQEDNGELLILGETREERMRITSMSMQLDNLRNMMGRSLTVGSPCCLVTGGWGVSWSDNMERITKAQALKENNMSSYMSGKKTREINTDIGIMEDQRKRAEANTNEKSLKDLELLLYDTALLTSGSALIIPTYSQLGFIEC